MPPGDRMEKEISTQSIVLENKARSVKFEGVKVGEKWYNTNSESRVYYLLVHAIALRSVVSGKEGKDQLPIIFIEDMKGDKTQVTVDFIFSLVDSIVSFDQSVDNAKKTHLSNIKKTASPLSYDVSVGWPETFVKG
jgi:hypothetical protein